MHRRRDEAGAQQQTACAMARVGLPLAEERAQAIAVARKLRKPEPVLEALERIETGSDDLPSPSDSGTRLACSPRSCPTNPIARDVLDSALLVAARYIRSLSSATLRPRFPGSQGCPEANTGCARKKAPPRRAGVPGDPRADQSRDRAPAGLPARAMGIRGSGDGEPGRSGLRVGGLGPVQSTGLCATYLTARFGSGTPHPLESAQGLRSPHPT
jgi:hypothetical protein